MAHTGTPEGTTTVLLNDLAFARPGDKGNDSDVTVFGRSREAYDHLVQMLTPERVKAHFGDMVRGEVTRWEVPNVWALKFLMRDALAGGGPSSLRADNLGKALGGAILRMPLDAPRGLVAHDIHPPTAPYAAQSWD